MKIIIEIIMKNIDDFIPGNLKIVIGNMYNKTIVRTDRNSRNRNVDRSKLPVEGELCI